MKELFNKISSYNLFNNLFPGAVFVVIMQIGGVIDLYQSNIFYDILICYFIGLIISRIGSIIIEPLLLKLKFITYTSRDRYINGCKNDSRIELLLEINNMYRTLSAMLLLSQIIYWYIKLENICHWLADNRFEITTISLLILFLLSYKKQTKKIVDRIIFSEFETKNKLE